MDKYSRLTSIYGGIWFAASVINGIISAFIILSSWHEGGLLIFGLSIGCSLVFSIPILIVAVVLGMYLLSIKVWKDIFQLILVLTFFVSLTGVILIAWFFNMFSSDSIALGFSIVVSSIIAVLIFQNKLKGINAIQE